MRIFLIILLVAIFVTISFYLGVNYPNWKTLSEEQKMSDKRKIKEVLKSTFGRLKLVEQSIAVKFSQLMDEKDPQVVERLNSEINLLKIESANTKQFLKDAYGFDQEQVIINLKANPPADIPVVNPVFAGLDNHGMD